MAKEPPFMPASNSPLNYLGCLIPLIILALFFSRAGGDERRKDNSLGVEAITAVKSRLRDPSSASFDELRASNGAYCGVVNSNNGLGGKTGNQRFAYSDGIALLEEDGRPFLAKWDAHCR